MSMLDYESQAEDSWDFQHELIAEERRYKHKSRDGILVPFPKKCKYCGEDDLEWSKTDKGWRLINKKRETHMCPDTPEVNKVKISKLKDKIRTLEWQLVDETSSRKYSNKRCIELNAENELLKLEIAELKKKLQSYSEIVRVVGPSREI